MIVSSKSIGTCGPSALLATAGPRVVDEDLTHETGRERIEVAAVVPVDRRGTHEAQIRLVNQRGGLKTAIPRAHGP